MGAARKLELGCPLCGSRDVYYTCTPNCCFNHVCGACNGTFEPVTRLAGETLTGVMPPEVLPEASDPTVACARCDATTVYLVADDKVACATCGSVLKVEFTEAAPA